MRRTRSGTRDPNVVDEKDRESIDEAMSRWRQGDCALGEHWFLFRLDTQIPITQEAVEAANEGANAAEAEVRGLMVATQTCDLVRNCNKRPFVEVCPLVEVDDDKLKDIERGRRPAYAYLPGVANQKLVADLDRVMTVEKAVVAKWKRKPGCATDPEVRQLALTLSRKRARFAFPDDFAAGVSKLRDHLSGKHGKNSDAGRALRGLREIRVRAAPSWDAPLVEIRFYFIRNSDTPDLVNGRWDIHLKAWLEFLESNWRFTLRGGVVQTIDDLTARDYIESDPLDLDHLSG